ncbi:MAG: methylmalonyl Co-A mutase-associated GTPase MeaB [Chloroflexota bacterium]|nr:methylmalonyl Co-A mutase-associated GTPase MeaB [Chloroflexota bacterium]
MSDGPARALPRDGGLVAQMLHGQRRALARVVSIVENGGPTAREALARLYPYTGRAHIVGITGPPGAGKSTLVNELLLELRRRERTAAVIAVDPTSPFTGGAVLGDRIRMNPVAGDPGVFIRSMASRGRLGGIARATGDVVKVFDAAGFDWVVVETVGAGQAEVDIAGEAHTTVVVEVPGLGDDVQTIKAGILEIADLFVVNKADREGADRSMRFLRAMLQGGGTKGDDGGWTIPVLPVVATRGEGVAEVVEAIQRHRVHLETTGLLREHERHRAAREVHALLGQLVLELVESRVAPEQRAALVARVEERALDPYAAAEELLGAALGVDSSIGF